MNNRVSYKFHILKAANSTKNFGINLKKIVSAYFISATRNMASSTSLTNSS
jgi:hypothetical protein